MQCTSPLLHSTFFTFAQKYCHKKLDTPIARRHNTTHCPWGLVRQNQQTSVSHSSACGRLLQLCFSLCLFFEHTPLVVKIFALLICMPFSFALPGQVEFPPSTLVEWDEQMGTEVPVPNVYAGLLHLFLHMSLALQPRQQTATSRVIHVKQITGEDNPEARQTSESVMLTWLSQRSHSWLHMGI